MLLSIFAGGLMSCASSSDGGGSSMQLYSPPFIALRAGSTIEVVGGTYTPQVNEIWHSNAEYQKRVREALEP